MSRPGGRSLRASGERRRTESPIDAHPRYTPTLDDLVALVTRPSGNLLDRPSLARLRAVTASLPAYIAEFFGFERRLGGRRAGTDFAFSLSTRGLKWLIESKLWPQLSKLAEMWQGRCPCDAITVWLEFDVSELASGEHPPNVFVTVDRVGSEPFALPPVIASPALQRCIEACPPSATRLQMGFMLSRATAALRVCALPMTYPQTMGFLTTVAWPGSLEDVGKALALYEHLCDGFGVHIDMLDSSPEASLGVELFYKGRVQEHQPYAEPRWDKLFAQLINDRLCTTPERDALFAWVSQRAFNAPRPARLLAALLHPNQMVLHGTLRTGLQHVKLCFSPKAPVRAKAYFGAVLEARE